ncbi:MAG: Fur family transcriptional regulator [Candidatus Margulisiibacteriota bacterium]
MRKKRSTGRITHEQNPLSGHGLKLTPQRTAIYDLIKDSRQHPCAEQVYRSVKKQLPNISFDTVYRTLQSFSEAGLINAVENHGRNQRFDPRTEQHHHFHCINCRKIVDFDCKEFDSLLAQKQMQKGFKIIRRRVVFEGLCKDCQKERRKTDTARGPKTNSIKRSS